MQNPILIREVNQFWGIYSCNVCQKEFHGLQSKAAVGGLKYCSISCANDASRAPYSKPRKPYWEIRKEVLERDALIIEQYVCYPHISLIKIAASFDVMPSIASAAVSKYLSKKGEFILCIESGINSQHAIDQEIMYDKIYNGEPILV